MTILIIRESLNKSRDIKYIFNLFIIEKKREKNVKKFVKNLEIIISSSKL
jgi:hypothetical protein